jgi:hypothetical protein
MRHVNSLLLLTALAAAACTSDPVNNTNSTGSGFKAVNVAGPGAITVKVDAVTVFTGVGQGLSTAFHGVTQGTHTIRIEQGFPTTRATEEDINFAVGDTLTIVAIDTSGTLGTGVLTDTGVVASSGHSKLRVAHYASNAPAVDIWRTQPDFATPTKVMFPFPYGAVSSYIESTPGDWTVFVTPEGVDSDTLVGLGPIPIGDGESWTVYLADIADTLAMYGVRDR